MGAGDDKAADILQGTLELLILRTLASGKSTATRSPNGSTWHPPKHCPSKKARCIQRCTGWNCAGC